MKAIGLFLKNSTLHSRVSSCSSKSSKTTGGALLDGQAQSPPLKFYPNPKQALLNYQSQGNLTSADRTKQTLVKSNAPTGKVKSTTPTSTRRKLMPT